MPEQDRTLYDRDQIERASTLVEHAISLGTLGPFQIEAAIAAVHCQAEAAAATDWVQIATLYELLESLEPSPVVRVNRAFAVAQADGPNAALELLDALQGSEQMDQYCYAWLVRGKLELMRQRPEAALPNLKRALELSRNTHEHREISRLIDEARGTPRERP